MNEATTISKIKECQIVMLIHAHQCKIDQLERELREIRNKEDKKCSK